MRQLSLFVGSMLISLCSALAQNTFTYTGSQSPPQAFSNNTLWSSGTAPSGTSSDGVIDKKIAFDDSRSVGNLTANADITVNSSVTFNLGSQTLLNGGTKKSLTLSNNTLIDVQGNLYIFGDLIAPNGLTLTVTGQIIVYGNITLGNGGDLIVSGTGNLQVKGNISGGNDTDITTTGSGTIAVTGGISTGGGGSSINGPTGSITAGSCNINGAACGTTVTPVDFIFFNSKLNENQVELSWATELEINFDYFDIERANDGINFISIGQLFGHGDSYQRIDYSFIDNLPLVGKNYYRLKTVDFDGYTEYSEIVLTNFIGEKQFQLSPNPSDGTSISAKVNFTPRENSLVLIYDNVGSIVGKFLLSGSESSFSFSEQLKPGVYYAKFSSDDFTKVSRFLVKE